MLRITFDGLCRNSNLVNAAGPAAWAWVAEEDSREVATNSGILPRAPGVNQITSTYAAALSALEYVTARGNSYALQRRRTGVHAELSSSSQVVVDLLKGRNRCESETLLPWYQQGETAKKAVTMPVVFSWRSGGVSGRIREICERVLAGLKQREQDAEERASMKVEFDAGVNPR